MPPLLLSRRFAPLFWCQFFAAFNDNFLKTSLVFLILFSRGGADAEALITLASAVFIAPYFFFSGLGGEIADRHDKARVAQIIKFVEMFVAGLAFIGYARHSVPILFVALGGYGVLGSLFGPIKYGILPDHLPREKLPAANALVEGATFIAILVGTIVGGLAAREAGSVAAFAVLVIGFALACWAASLFIPTTGIGAPQLKVRTNIFASTAAMLRHLRADSRLWWGAMVTSWFWLVGIVVLSLLPPLIKTLIGGDEATVTTYLAMFSIAVGIGSGLAARIAHGRIVLGTTLAGAVLLGLFAIDLGIAAFGAVPATSPQSPTAVFATPLGIRTAIDLVGLAISGGLFIVPAFAAVQAWAGVDYRARTIAAVNVLNAAFMTGATVVVAILQKFGVTVPMLFVIIGVATLLVAVAIGRTMPTSWLRDFIAMLLRLFYRLEVHGLENVDKAGPNAIIALNHVSFLDPPIAMALLPKDPIFAIDVGIASRWWIKPFLKMSRTFALDPLKPMATRTLINAVRDGDTLVIFPEGRITVTGRLMKVYDGAGLIADKSNAMVVPVRIDGPEATIFSRLKRSQVRRRWFPKVTVTVLEPVRLTVDPELKGRKRRQAAGAALYDVMSNLIFNTTSTDRTVAEAIIEAARIHGYGWAAIEDPVSGKMTYRRLLQASAILGAKLMPLAGVGKPVGVMLPTANGGVVTMLALMSAGRVPAMINFSAGVANILAACGAAQLDTIVTARSFVEKGRLDKLVAALSEKVKIVYLEDIRPTITVGDKLRGLLAAGKPLIKRAPDDWAAILFTSGSEGVPKGVVLSHRNMLANMAQATARIDFGREDKVFNALPIFHSFGLTVGVVLPLCSGVPIYLYPSPLHYRNVPELIYGVNATIVFGTDTFLNGYARAAHAYDFRSVRYIMAGAEPVKDSTRMIYMEKFGVRILEGYGVTETAPALALNTPMFNKFGTVGRILPGMTARLDKVEGVEEGGRLFVRGPNVMLGYLRAEHPGVLEPPPEGWHDTGDIVTIDPQGFVAIKGRAKRFAKVGGEMISLAAIEMLASELWPNALVSVAAIPDARKGERLILVTDKRGATRQEFQAFAKSKHAADLMIPAEVIHLDKLPVLGSGKVDNLTVQKFVREQAAAKVSAAE